MRADRLLSIVLLLQTSGGMTAQTLARQLEVSERTIYRDIEALSIAGIPIYTLPGINGGVFLDEGYRGTLAGLKSDEAQAMVLASRSGPLEDLGMDKAASGLLVKLLAALPAAQRDAAERLRRRIFIDPDGWFHSNERVPFLQILHKMVWEDRVIELRYQRPDGEPTQRELQPYALIAKANVWYLIGKQADGEMRTFRVSRIQDVQPKEICFEREDGFNLTSYWQEQCQLFERQMLEGDEPCDVLVRVEPSALRVFVSDLSGQYERFPDPDENGWIRLKISFTSPGSAQMRVLSYGKRVEVLDPAWMRERVARELEELVRMYQP